jgi:hypothetical protein
MNDHQIEDVDGAIDKILESITIVDILLRSNKNLFIKNFALREEDVETSLDVLGMLSASTHILGALVDSDSQRRLANNDPVMANAVAKFVNELKKEEKDC